MDILKPRNETRYQVAINFKPDTQRQAIEALMPRREYKRLQKAILRNYDKGAFEFIMDGHVTEVTFPIAEIDTVHAVPEIDYE